MATTTAPPGFGRPIWSAIKGGSQVHGVGLVPVVNTFEGHANTFERILFTAPSSPVGGFWKVEAANLAAMTTIAAHGSNQWQFKLQVGTFTAPSTIAWTDLGDAAVATTGAVALTADLPYALDVDGPESASPKLVFLGAGDSVRLLATKVASGVDQAANYFTVTLLMRHSPPGR